MRGGEKVLEELCRMFPRASIYTLVADRSLLSSIINAHELVPSLLQRIPGASKSYKSLLPLFPFALRRLRVRGNIDFLFSIDASMVKGLNVPESVPHVCYCCSPPRYLFDLQDQYLDSMNGMNALKRTTVKALTPLLQEFDRQSAQRVTHFITLSNFIAERMRRCYGRESTVIYPPVSVDDFIPRERGEEFYLVVTQLVPYKRIDLAVMAFNQLGKKLVIIGDGSEMESLRAKAKQNITFLGRQPFSVLKDHYERCRAFIFPGIEDFGITVLESQAAGRPVIAFRSGGTLETIVEGRTGVFFDEQSPECLATAVTNFERQLDQFDPQECRKNAERFRPSRFRAEIKSFLEKALPNMFARYDWPVEGTSSSENR